MTNGALDAGLKIATEIGKKFIKNRASIFIIGGMVSCVGATITAATQTPKYLRLKHELECLPKEDRTAKDYLDCATPYILPATLLSIGLFSIGYGHKVDMDNYAELLAMYTLQSNSYADLKAATKEVLGPKKQEELEAKKAEKAMERSPYSEESFVENADDKGNDLIFDCLSGRYFRSSINAVEAAVNRFNKMLLYQNWGSLNDMYDEIGIPEIKLGDEIGWSVDKDMPELEKVANFGPNDEPCICIDFSMPPNIGYRDIF